MTFDQAIQQAIVMRANTIADEEIAALKERIEKRVRSATAEIAATVVRKMWFEPYGANAIKIIVEFPEKK